MSAEAKARFDPEVLRKFHAKIGEAKNAQDEQQLFIDFTPFSGIGHRGRVDFDKIVAQGKFKENFALTVPVPETARKAWQEYIRDYVMTSPSQDLVRSVRVALEKYRKIASFQTDHP